MKYLHEYRYKYMYTKMKQKCKLVLFPVNAQEGKTHSLKAHGHQLVIYM